MSGGRADCLAGTASFATSPAASMISGQNPAVDGQTETLT